MLSQNRWESVSIFMLQKSQSVELVLWHLVRNWLVGIMCIRCLYWKFLSLISIVDFCAARKIAFQLRFEFKKSFIPFLLRLSSFYFLFLHKNLINNRVGSFILF